MMPKAFLLLAAVLAMGGFAQGQTSVRDLYLRGATWHVSPTGDDAHPGTAEAPFASAAKALESASPGDLIVLGDEGAALEEDIVVRTEAIRLTGTFLRGSVRYEAPDGWIQRLTIKTGTVGVEAGENAHRLRVNSNRIVAQGISAVGVAVTGRNLERVHIYNNQIYAVRGTEAEAGIRLEGPLADGFVHHNSLRGFRTGIALGDMQAGELADFAGLRVWLNRLDGNGVGIAAAGRQFALEDNRVRRSAETGLAMKGDATATADRNVVREGGGAGIVAAGGTYLNNVVHSNAGGGIVVRPAPKRTRILHATLQGNGGTALSVQAEADAFFANSLVAHEGAAWDVRGRLEADFNAYCGSLPEGEGLHSAAGEVLFADAANGDLRLLEGSMGVDAASAAHAPAYDRDLTGRPVAAAPDAGAYETAPREGIASGRAYFVAPDGDDAQGDGSWEAPFATVNRIQGELRPGDTLMLKSGEYREEVQLACHGAPGHPITVTKAPGADVVVRDLRWHFDGATHVTVTGLTFRECYQSEMDEAEFRRREWIAERPDYSAGAAIHFNRNASFNRLAGNRFLDCPPDETSDPQKYPRGHTISGKGYNAARNVIEDNLIRRNQTALTTVAIQPLPRWQTRWEIRGNTISGYFYGIQPIGGAGRTGGHHVIERNTFTNTYDCVHIKGSNNVIRYNHFHDLSSSGAGGQWGRTRRGDRMTAVGFRSGSGNIAYGNRIDNSVHGFIVFVGGPHYIANNLLTNVTRGVWYRWGGPEAWIVNNTFYNVKVGVHTVRGATARLHNNIFVGDGEGQMVHAYDWGLEPVVRSSRPGRLGAGRVVAENNLFYGLEGPPLLGQCPDWATNVEADPLFVDPEGGDFRLRRNSPARGLGVSAPYAARDFFGRPRPELAPDAGAIQSEALP